jgi:nitrogen fixation NifU-like protein
MITELEALYQEVILDHYKRPRNWGPLAAADRQAEGHNPLCGDRITVQVAVDGEQVKDVHVQGVGCAISVASASLMSEAVRGKTLRQARALFERFHDLVTGGGGNRKDTGNGHDAEPPLGKLAVFTGVRRFPARIRCAILPWHALRAALENGHGTVSTEESA